MTATFMGYERENNLVGIRNHTVVLSTVTCANHVTTKIAGLTGAIPITHNTGCLQIGEDLEQTLRTIIGCAKSPNVGAVLFVGLGCEQTPTKELPDSVEEKPSAYISIQDSGGTRLAIEKGVEIVKELLAKASRYKRRQFSISMLRIALKCGGSDFTSALASNPAVGVASDIFVQAGAGVFLNETSSFPGSEHILASKAVNRDVAKQIYNIIDFYREEISYHFKRDITDGNPSPGNIEGGITTLVEKTLGSIKKAGKSQIEGVLQFAEDVRAKTGLWIMDTPGHDVFSVSGVAAGGAHVCLFTTGRGTPLGNPIMPVIKISGNPSTYELMEDNIDINAGTIMLGEETIEQVGKQIFQTTIEVASGQKTKSEILEHWEFAIPRIGSTL